MQLLGLYDSNFLNTKKTLGSKEELLKQINLTVNEIEEKIKIRNEAKKNKNWVLADSIRDDLSLKGIILKDSIEGTTWEVNF